MSLLVEIREWTGWLLELGIFIYVAREFYYDRDKDLAKKQKKTKTTKKVTTEPSGVSTTEETTEIFEPSPEEKK